MQLGSLPDHLVGLVGPSIPNVAGSNETIRQEVSIKQHGALKRQRQYIGKLMRDADMQDIASRLEQIRHKHDLNNIHFKRLEQWRDRVLQAGDQAINELIAEYPLADRQYLRQLHRNSIKEARQNKPPAAARLLFKYLRELSE